MKPTRRTFMQTAAAFFSGLFGLEAAEEILDRAKPRKVMVPGVDFERIRIPTHDEVQKIIGPYRTRNYNPQAGALHQELLVGEPGYWRTGNYVGREGAKYGDLLRDKKVPVGCQLGPNARLIHVDEARKTLKFELDPSLGEEWRRRYALAERKCPPPKAIVHYAESYPGEFAETAAKSASGSIDEAIKECVRRLRVD